MCERERRLTIPPEKFTRPRHTQSAVVGALEKRDERFKTQHPEKGEKRADFAGHLGWSGDSKERQKNRKAKRSNFNFTENTVPHTARRAAGSLGVVALFTATGFARPLAIIRAS